VYDVQQEPPIQGTLNQAQKYKKTMPSLCQFKLAQLVWFNFEKCTVLQEHCYSGFKCVIVSCDEEDQPTQERPVQADKFDVTLDESPVQCEVVTLHEQELEEETTITNKEEEDTTDSKEEVTVQLATTSATLLPIMKSSIHLKPSSCKSSWSPKIFCKVLAIKTYHKRR